MSLCRKVNVISILVSLCLFLGTQIAYSQAFEYTEKNNMIKELKMVVGKYIDKFVADEGMIYIQYKADVLFSDIKTFEQRNNLDNLGDKKIDYLMQNNEKIQTPISLS